MVSSRRTGDRVTGTIGDLCNWVGELRDRLVPTKPGRPRRQMSRILLWIAGSATLLYLCAPSLFVVPVSFTAEPLMTFPPRGFSMRWYEAYFSSPLWLRATVRSFVVASATAVLATALGTAAAFVLVRQRLPGASLLMVLVLAPIILPRTIIAVALYYLFARLDMIGTMIGLILGHTLLAVPYVVITLSVVLQSYDMRQDQAAWSLGASKWRTLLRVTFPQIRAGLVAAFLFAFVTSFDDLTIALFISGGSKATLPRQMWDDILLQVNPTLAAVSTVMLVFITIIIICAEGLRRKAMPSNVLG